MEECVAYNSVACATDNPSCSKFLNIHGQINVKTQSLNMISNHQHRINIHQPTIANVNVI